MRKEDREEERTRSEGEMKKGNGLRNHSISGECRHQK